MEPLGNLVKDTICNKIFLILDELEEAVLAELEPLWQSADAVGGLLGIRALVASANVCAKY